MARGLVVEADGGSRGNPGPAGYGAVVLDPAGGETLAEVAEYIGHATNNVAEYRGLIAGLRAAKALDPEAVVRVRMDSKLVVEQMSGRWKIKHPDMRPLAAEAKAVLPVGQVTYEWIPREKNKHADRLANEAMDAGKRGRQWEPQAPVVRSELGLGGGIDVAVPAEGSAADAVRDTLPEAAPTAGWSAPADLGTPTTFVLLRHGETALTPEKRFSGSGGGDPDLSEKGRWQAQQAATAFAASGRGTGAVQAIVSSPLARCRQTAEAVATRLGLDVRIDEGLRETDFGSFEGLTFAEVRERFPAELDAWLASADTAPPGGESFAAVARRVALSRDKLLARYAGKTVLLVTHVTPVKTLVRLALGAPPESMFRMELAAASVSTVAYYADGNASLRLLNDTSHVR
ncbi:bifunctional RNase H/acid phosphatase [Streptomyces sp. SPB162]|uniref:bifunctional RNase H/acid phosphatase n=1 Tax=Streptomyces sp. SPB162 TaxID=2940560 RepID=UPI00240577A4|nr:bifunctional RNase H/acid phosphatase [Streptomyces sp. SPB162]MDF9812860.1 broad specificity phosphatase PhoE/ribonuclease HI [Streptomyces sp. SPB162]